MGWRAGAGARGQVLALAALLGLVACSPPADRCVGAICPGDTVCDPVTYKCVRPELLSDAGGGPGDSGTDAGAVEDGGAPSQDGGAPDAGPTPPDAGLDAGEPDAGEPDAGAPDAGPAAQDAGCQGAVVELLPQDFDGGFALLGFDVAQGADFGAGGCVIGGGGGRQRMWHLSLAAPTLLSVDALPGTGADPVVYVKAAACDAPGELVCVDQGFKGQAERLSRLPLDAGEYVVVVDTYSAGSAGHVDVAVTLEGPGAAPGNDSCASPQPLTFVSGTATQAGDTTFANNSNVFPDGTPYFTPSCSASAALSGRDLVYTVTVPPGPAQDLALQVTPASGSTLAPMLWVAKPNGCGGYLPAGGSAELACGPPTAAGTLRLSGLAPGTYPVWVDGRGGTFGRFVLTATLSPAVTQADDEDLCSAARPVLTDGGAERLSGTLLGRSDDSQAACGWGIGKDLYYRFTTTTPQRLTAVVTPTTDAGYRPLVYLLAASLCRADGGLTTTPLSGCAASGTLLSPTRLDVSVLDAGTWLLAVDAVGNSYGDFDLDLSLSPPLPAPANDTCANAAPLTFTTQPWGSVAVVTGSTRGATQEFTSACASAGPDVSYAFTTLGPGFLGYVNFKATVWTNDTVEVSPTLTLRSSCAASPTSCGESIGGQAVVNGFGAGTNAAQVLMVDQAAGAGGPFTLQVEMTSTPTDNDQCPNAQVLPLDTSVAGSTLGAKADYSGTDGGYYFGGTSCLSSLPGVDVVYAFTPADAGVYTVRLVPDRSFDPALVAATGCDAGSCLAMSDKGLAGDEERLSISMAAATTYYLFVDSFSANPSSGPVRGGFVISVSGP